MIPNDLSTPAALVTLLERDLERTRAGICLDFGHAHLMGDVADAVEIAAEHVIATHVHDNRGREDDHLVPFLGTINWDMALMTMQKIGYEGTYLMELANTGTAGGRPRGSAARAAAVRTHTGTIHDCLHPGHRGARRPGRHAQGLAAQPPLERQDPFPDAARRHRLHPVRHDEAGGRRGGVQAGRPPRRRRAAIIVDGTVRADARAPGGYEVDVTALEVVSESQNYPISPKEHGVDFLMDRRHLWIRSQRQQAILRVRHEVINAVRDFFNERGFILADTPIFTPAACEGTTTLFPVQYFDDETAYLTQSGQLYNEANAMALGRVYCFGPTFRAEKSKTRRHLTEFWMVEPEMAYATLDDVMDLAEALVVSVVAARARAGARQS